MLPRSHRGELAVQTRVGVRELIGPWAKQVVRPFLPDQHREFYTQLPFVVAAARDEADRPWATLLTGSPGFVQSPDERGLFFTTRTLPGDALEGSLIAGADLGLLGIELQTRRRNRVNGVITENGAGGISIRSWPGIRQLSAIHYRARMEARRYRKRRTFYRAM